VSRPCRSSVKPLDPGWPYSAMSAPSYPLLSRNTESTPFSVSLVGMGERAGDAETGPAASALTRSEGGGQVKRHVHLDFSLAGIDFRAGSSRLDVLGGVAD